jgi:hypothetical protein
MGVELRATARVLMAHLGQFPNFLQYSLSCLKYGEALAHAELFGLISFRV